MIYIVKVYDNAGALLLEREVLGMVEVDKIQAAFPETAGFEVDFHPDVFRYMNRSQSVSLS